MQLADKMCSLKLHDKQKDFLPSQESTPSHILLLRHTGLHPLGCPVLSGLSWWTRLLASVIPWPGPLFPLGLFRRVNWCCRASTGTSWIPDRFGHVCRRWGLWIGGLFTPRIFAPWMWSGSHQKLVETNKRMVVDSTAVIVLKLQLGN